MSLLDRLLSEHIEEQSTAPVTPQKKQGSNELAKLRQAGYRVELINGDKVKINPRPPRSWIPRLVDAKPEIIEALKSEQLAIRTVWRWAINTGDTGTYRSNATTYEQARQQLEREFPGCTVTHLEFISAMAEGFGFIDYQPEGERHANHS